MSELKPQRYREERRAEQFQYVHESSRSHEPNWVYELVRLILTPIALLIYRTRGSSASNVPARWRVGPAPHLVFTPFAVLICRAGAISASNGPASGPVILAPNPFSNMDHFFSGVYTRRKI